MSYIYDIGLFDTISHNGFDYKLPIDVIHCLTSLHARCSHSSTPYKQVTFKKIVFTSTKPGIVREDSGIPDQSPSIEMRLALNKITNKTYLTNIDNIVNIFNNTLESDIPSLEHTMMETFTNNRFYAKLYADIFSICLQSRPNFMNCFKTQYNIFIESFNHIVYVDPNIDYDLFCKNNLIQEKQKTFTCFMLHLTLNAVITKVYINNMISILSTYINNNMNSSDNIYTIDEMVENIVLCYTTTVFDEHNIKFVEKLSSYRPKQFPGLSSKTIFKLMDIV